MSEIQGPSIMSVLSEVRSNKNILPSVQEIESQLSEKTTQMSNCEKSGKYTEAQSCKENIERLKKQLQEKKLYDMVLKHKREKRKMQKAHEEEFIQLNTFWSKKIDESNAEGEKFKQEMETRHQSEIVSTKGELESQISNKVKESSECLNLRKIEEQMAKQQKYAQAHQIQQQVRQLEKKQLQMFQKQRQTNIQVALNVLRNKQKAEKQALQQKTKSNQCELLKQKESEILRLKHRNQNAIKELKSQQEKEILALKGQLKNKVTITSVKSRSKLLPLLLNTIS